MSPVVLDASVASQLIVPEIRSEAALRLVEDAAAAQQRLVAPSLLHVEVTNIVRKRMRADRLTIAQARTLLDDFLTYPITLLDPAGIHHAALTLTEAHSLGTPDAHYVALAQMLGGDLWVDDGRLPFVK